MFSCCCCHSCWSVIESSIVFSCSALALATAPRTERLLCSDEKSHTGRQLMLWFRRCGCTSSATCCGCRDALVYMILLKLALYVSIPQVVYLRILACTTTRSKGALSWLRKQEGTGYRMAPTNWCEKPTIGGTLSTYYACSFGVLVFIIYA